MTTPAATSQAVHASGRPGSRNFGLDVVRACAITMVLLGHGVSLSGIPFVGDFVTGVDLFFVLSGFLIGRIYFSNSRRPGFTMMQFWRARWWRTIPPYAAALALTWIMSLSPRTAAGMKVDWTYLVFAQNYAGLPAFIPSWSLCVEEHFYLCLPIVAWLIERTLGRRAFGYLLPGMFLVPTLLRAATYYSTGGLPEHWPFYSHFHSEGLIAGVFLAYLQVDRPESFGRLRKPCYWLLPIVPVLWTILPVWNSRTPDINIWVFTAYAIGYAAWLRIAWDLRWQPVSTPARLLRKAITGLALCSYSLYLTHTQSFVIRNFMDNMHRGAGKTSLVLCFGLIGGVAFYFCFERPSIRLRDWLETRARRHREETQGGVSLTS